MATMNVSLPDPMKEWVERQANGGRYSNASDYVRDLIRRDQERTEKIARMQRLVSDGLDSGEGDRSMSELRDLAHARVSPQYSPAARGRLDFEAWSGLATSPCGLKTREGSEVRA